MGGQEDTFMLSGTVAGRSPVLPRALSLSPPSLPGQMESSSFLIIKISASLKRRSMLLSLQITAFVREEQ